MFGALIMVVVLIVGFPVVFMTSGGVIAAFIGQSLWHDAEARSPSSELLTLNR